MAAGEYLKQKLGIDYNETTPDGKYTLSIVAKDAGNQPVAVSTEVQGVVETVVSKALVEAIVLVLVLLNLLLLLGRRCRSRFPALWRPAGCRAASGYTRCPSERSPASCA